MNNNTKGHEHKLDLVCLQCVINKYKQYDLLLEFTRKVRKQAAILVADSITYEAFKLLKEIGEIE